MDYHVETKEDNCEIIFLDQEVRKLPKALELLTPREKEIIQQRYLIEKPEYLNHIGKRHNISEERVRQIEVVSLLKMRHYMEQTK